jgi:Trk K+ transport system NAD-binding subunit
VEKQDRRRRRDLRTAWLYLFVVLKEFKWTIFFLFIAVGIGGYLHWITPQPELNGARPSVFMALFGAWMMLFATPLFLPPAAWYLEVVAGLYPLLGVLIIGEGIVRFALLMVSRRRGEKEWMKVMASTYRDHVILCGIGHLGFRVLQSLVQQGRPVVAIEKDAQSHFLEQAKATGVPILVRDMKDDATLLDAGVKHARAILIATNDDIANVEVALDARRLNPKIKIAMRQFDQQMASKFKDAFGLEFAFSSSALSAPTVAAMALDCHVIAAFDVAGVPHVAAEVRIGRRSLIVGRTIGELESLHHVRVLCRTPRGQQPESPPSPATVITDGDLLLVHSSADEAEKLAKAARADEPATASA